jgi:hypothetical protein
VWHSRITPKKGICCAGLVFERTHWRQEPFLVTCKTYAKPCTFVKYVIKLVGTTNPIADSKLVEEYVMNNKANQIFLF